MRRSFPIVEQVFKIDSGDYVGRTIFPSFSADATIQQKASTIVTGAIKGNLNPLIKAYETEDRNSNFVLVNITRVNGFTEDVVDVPLNIKNLVQEYNELYPKYYSSKLKGEDIEESVLTKINNLSAELVEYFEK